MVAQLIALAAQVVALLILVPRYGANGAAWAYSFFFVVYLIAIIPFSLTVLRRCRRLLPAEA